MSILLSAKRQHERPSSAFEASLGRGVERERRWMGPVLAWVIGMPLCLLLGAGANYGWHWWHNQPIEERVELKEPTPLPYRLATTAYEFTTIPFPVAPEMTEVVMPTPTVAPRATDPLSNMNMDGVSPALAQRFMQAVQAAPGNWRTICSVSLSVRYASSTTTTSRRSCHLRRALTPACCGATRSAT